MEVPDINTTNFFTDKDACKKMLDYAVQIHDDRMAERNKNQRMYDSYNGAIDKKKIAAITRKYGQDSKIPFRSFRIGRTKVKQLVGEHLRIQLRPSVVTLNPEARIAKLEERRDLLGIAYAKPLIEKAKSMGMNVYDGIKIPGKEDLGKFKNLKTINESIMQIVLKYKMKSENIHLRINDAFKYATQTCIMAGVIEKNDHGADEFRAFPSENAIFLEAENDFMCERSPIKGEKRLMYKSELLRTFKFSKEDKEKLDQIEKESIYGNDSSVIRADKVGALFPVWIAEWSAKRTLRKKYTPSKLGGEDNINYISQKYYYENEKKIKKDVKQGRYKIEEEEDWTIFRGARVGNDLYLGMEEAEDLIKWTDPNGFEHTESNYIIMLLDTIGGKRVPIQEVIDSISMMYDTIMFLFFREINKFKGDHIVIDKAYFPKHSKTSKIMYDLAEEGVIEVNSSAEGNRSGIDSDGGVDKFVKSNSVTAGLNHIQNLLASADKLEMLLDSVTGMNRDRSGVAMASSTATANQSNLQASRDMTYELFYYANIYAEKVLSMLLEKTKINHEWLNTESGNFILSDNEYKFLRITSDISNDSYGALLDDGKRDMEIMDQMLPVFLQEVNARKLRSYDVIRFMRSAGLTDGLLALEEAYKVISDVENKAKEQEIQSREKSEELARKDAKNQFEDMQRHDLEKIITKGKMDENKEITKARMNAGIIDKQIMADLMKQRQDIDGKLQQIAEQGQLDMQQMQEQGMQDSMNSGAEE
jgi:hypothetical protein